MDNNIDVNLQNETPVKPKKVLKPLELLDIKPTHIMLFSFLMPFVICLVVFLVAGFYPLGTKQIIVTDFWHQYFPIIRELRETILEGGSLLWNWHSGLGTNFLAMLGYYGASPLNLLTLLMPESFLQLGVTLIVFIKIGLCGLFFSVFLMKAFERRDISVIFFSCLYATCACVMGYFWNLMWLDSIAIFPLVVLGVILLIRDRKPLLYTVSLALALLFNYYIGVYICIAVLLLSVCTVVITWSSLKDAILAFFRMVVHSAIGIGITAVLLLPSYLALQNSYYAVNSSVGETLWNGKASQFLSALFPYQFPNTKDLVTPNLCCGLVCVFLFVLFLCSNAKIREKICSSLILGVLFFSFLYRPLDYLWNGAHYVNQIPFRYSFIFSFVLIACAYRAYCLMHKTDLFSIGASLLMTAIVACLMYQYLATYIIVLCVVTALVYAVILILYNSGVTGPKLTSGLMCGVIAVECAVAGAFGFSGYSDYVSYREHSEDINYLFDSVADGTFYREEMTNTKTLNDPLFYGYNGVSQFSSSANGRISTYLKTMGVGGNPAGNRYAYYQSTPLMNSSLAVRYLVSKAGTKMKDMSLSKVNASGECVLYENKYFLPIAYTVNGDVDEDKFLDYRPFENQNQLFTAMTGINEKLFTTHSINMPATATGGNIDGGNGSYKYTQTGEKITLRFEIECQRDGLYYFYPRIRDAGNVAVAEGAVWVYFNAKHTQAAVLPAGYRKAGEKIIISTTMTSDGEPHNAFLSCAVMDQQVFEKGYSILSSGSMTDITHTDTSISGKVNAENDGTLLYTSIPYEKGWRAYVDGKEADISPYADTFVSVSLTEGEHTVEFKYTPDGFVTGAVVTAVSIALCALSAYLYPKYHKRKKEKDSAEA